MLKQICPHCYCWMPLLQPGRLPLPAHRSVPNPRRMGSRAGQTPAPYVTCLWSA